MTSHIPIRPLGKNGPPCSILGFGTGRLRSASTGLSQAEAVRLVQHATTSGITFIDTADSYGQGESEAAIGRAVRGQRKKFVIATKAGFRFSAAGPFIRMIKPVIGGIVRRIAGVARAVSKARGSARKIGVLRQNFAPAAIVAAVEASLRRLGTDYIDVFFLHEATLDAVRDGELWGALLQLRAEGKLRHLGISSNDTAVLEASLSLPDLSAIETAVNPMRPAALWPLLENFSSLGIGVVANQIFGSGRLLRTDPDEKAAVIRIQLLTRANSLSLSPRAFLLAFALSAPGVASALTGTTNTVHLDENFGDLSAVIARTSLDWATLRDCFQVEH